jgi:DnaA family protein
MQQLALNIQPLAPVRLEDIVPGTNAEVLAMLRAVSTGKLHEPVYLWGPPGCGKSLMLAALRESLPDATLVIGSSPSWPAQATALLIDDVDRLDEIDQVEAFNRYNRNKAATLAWAASGSQAPAGLNRLREDLRTRLGWGLVYQLHPLNDVEKRQALVGRADQLGFELDGAIADYLLTRYSRDLGQLLAVVDALDRFSLEQQRRVSLPLLKTLLPRQG